MDMTAEAMQKTLDISNPQTHEVEDVHGIKTTFSTKPLFQIKAAPPEEPQPVNVATLAGFADLIKSQIEDIRGEDWLIHIQDERTVALKKKDSYEFGRRLSLIQAQPVPFKQFQFGQWVSQEEFVIAVASLFSDAWDKDYILGLASSLTSDATSLSEDDGFSQRAVVKAGLRQKESVTLKPRVTMAPYRTFPEIEQPVSEFVFRARANSENGPSLMLVEADGGRWKVDAIGRIRAAMEAFGLTIPIIA